MDERTPPCGDSLGEAPTRDLPSRSARDLASGLRENGGTRLEDGDWDISVGHECAGGV
ncbi:hypothetical protein GCM10017668_65320 [Streptomyces tuirus]|uniref:Uncharacterized protein n=1 Tax=Streptomyces tuirus TaxID=68278 RepID=A0A7G1NPE5_9ACTN|nr:hypothetical protein GCM10017668_65320 [Streptomyces tuirus]